ncbi:MAG: tetratricopeptide repeat protein [Candidatus Sericytochromatia bacterium]|nr:tetratricopeptide repeat protein [Candidatus Tanganyikabacteria bacterium]
MKGPPAWALPGAVALGLLMAIPASGQGASLGRQLAEARLRAIADGDVAGAVPLYQAMVDQASGSALAEAASELGELLEALGRDPDAQEAYRTALAADPLNARAAGRLARLGGLGPLLSAGAGTSSAGTAPLLPQGWEALLPPAERLGFRAQVDRYARQHAARALLAAGKRQWAQRDRDRAVATFGLVVSQFAAELSAHDLQEVAETLMAGGQAALASGAFEKAIAASIRPPRPASQSQLAWLRFRLGEAYMQAGSMAEARAAFREIMDLGPGIRAPGGRALAIPAEIHYRETRGLASWQDLQAVQALWRQAQDAQYVKHQPDEAANLYRRIGTEYPDSNYDGRSLVQLATIFWFENQDARGALDAIDLVLQNDRKDDLWPDGMRAGAWALFHQGRVREAGGDRAGARTSYKQLLDDWPEAADHDGKPFAARAIQRLSLLGGLP